MDKDTKQKLRRLWRNRLLMGMSGLVVLGFSALQLQVVFKHRPQQPSWSLKLAQSIAVLTNEESSAKEIEQAQFEIRYIAKERQLFVTESLIRSLMRDLNRSMNLTQAQAHLSSIDLTLTQAQTQARDLELEPDLVQALDPVRTQVQVQVQAQAQVHPLDLAQMVGVLLNPGLAPGLPVERDRELIEDLDLILLSVDQALDLALLQNSLFVDIVVEELEKTYGLTLQQGRNLESILSGEPNRIRIFIQSGILFGLSIFLLTTLLLGLTRLKSSYSLPAATQLIAFLPEDWVAELGALQRCMKKAKASTWEIRLRLIEEFLTLLWVFYIQVRLENLGLPPGDHKVDD